MVQRSLPSRDLCQQCNMQSQLMQKQTTMSTQQKPKLEGLSWVSQSLPGEPVSSSTKPSELVNYTTKTLLAPIQITCSHLNFLLTAFFQPQDQYRQNHATLSLQIVKQTLFSATVPKVQACRKKFLRAKRKPDFYHSANFINNY